MTEVQQLEIILWCKKSKCKTRAIDFCSECQLDFCAEHVHRFKHNCESCCD